MPVKTMVIQRARLGDLLQTLPLIRTLEALGEDVTCLVSQDMVEAARLAFPEGRVAGFPGKGSLLEIASASPLKAAGKIHRLLKDFGNTSYDRILQLNHDGTGVLLGRLLPASERRGFWPSRTDLFRERVPNVFRGGPPISSHPRVASAL